MPKILLISANTRTVPYPVYPVGMAMIAEALVRGGHTVRLHDPLFPEAPLPSILQAFAPDVVGVSIRNLDSANSLEETTDTLANVRNLVAEIRAHSRAKVLLGGAGFSVMPAELLAATAADAGIVGPGEREVCRVVESLLAPESKATNEISASTQPLIPSAFDADITPLLNPESARLLRCYQSAGGVLGVLTKRGCAYRCAYCAYPMVDGRAFAPHDPQRVAAHIKALEEQTGAEEIFFTDSVFNDNSGYAVALAREMIRQKTRVRFAAYFTPARLDVAELELFQQAGLFAIELGTDAASNVTLRGLAKGFRFAQVAAFQKACVERRIPCAHFVIFGGPDETPETVREGLANLAALEHCVVLAFSGVRIHSGTALHRRAVREGKITANADLLQPHYYFSDAVDIPAMNAQISAAFRGRRDRIFPPQKGDEITAALRQLGYKGLLWNTLVRF